jgi:Arc/MetJ family transcription regulator
MAKEKADPPDAQEAEKIKWRDDVAAHDYAAAEAYLSLKLDSDAVGKAVKRLRKVPITRRRANDILRAAGLSPAPLDDPGVMKDLIKVIEGTRLSPVLVVSDGVSADIADGYHRVSLVYRIDPYGEVPLKLAGA